MHKRLNVLISAYFCYPHKGSEESVGWNFSTAMAKYHNVWVITQKSNQKAIEEELSKNPIDGLSFFYYEFPQNWFFNEKRLGEQASYIIWQLFAINFYRKISKLIVFDLVHHLTFNQYRTPSFGFLVKKPFVMGPVGGAELIDPVFFRDLTKGTQLKERWRIIGLDRYLFGFATKLRSNPKVFVFSSYENHRNLSKHVGKKFKSTVIPAISIKESDFNQHIKIRDIEKPFTVIYAGKAKDWKGLLLLLKSIKEAFDPGQKVLVKLIGIRNENENQRVVKWIKENELTNIVTLINFMPQNLLLEELKTADLSVYPAFRDSGSMSVLEACALNCPVLCLDAGGQDVFPDDILLKIPVSSESYDSTVANVANGLRWAFNNPLELSELGLKAQAYVFEHFTWSGKVKLFHELYCEVLSPEFVNEAGLVNSPNREHIDETQYVYE